MSQPVDGKAYYGYLFETDKKPTKVLDALLRGIANYISDFVGNKEEKCLTPAKLASFYKAVGGNYDSLFVDVPNPSISWIYASIGCQHTLQPTTDDFAPPSVPALTTKGFVRWQSIEILLGPEEHVPFMQNAVRNFAIKNPDNGESFPADLPTEAFPLQTDAEIEKWHSQCAEKLRQRATPNEDEGPPLPPRPKVRATYSHVRPARSRPASDYFEPKSRGTTRPISYQHVSETGRPVRPKLSRSPTHRAQQFLAPEAPDSPRLARGRRRSFPENLNSSPIASPAGEVQPTNLQSPHEHARRHSHPRHARRGSVSSDASSENEDPPSPRSPMARRRSHPHAVPNPPRPANEAPVPPNIRFAFPPPEPPMAAPTPPDPRLRTRENRERDEELKRRSFPIPIDLTGKLSAPFLLGKREREHGALRSNSRGANVKWKDLTGDDVAELWRRGSKSSEEDRERAPQLSRRHSRDERAERDSGGSGRDYKRRERERDREPVRPRLQARRSSHDDTSRSYRDRDRDRDRDRERERERDAIGRGTDGRSFRDRDRDRRMASPVRGINGRRYPPVDAGR